MRVELIETIMQMSESVYFSLFFQKNVHNMQIQNQSCDILTDAIGRYKRIIQQLLERDIHIGKHDHGPNIVEHPHPEFRNNTYFVGFLDEISINLTNPCENAPHSQMQEACKLVF